MRRVSLAALLAATAAICVQSTSPPPHAYDQKSGSAAAAEPEVEVEEEGEELPVDLEDIESSEEVERSLRERAYWASLKRMSSRLDVYGYGLSLGVPTYETGLLDLTDPDEFLAKVLSIYRDDNWSWMLAFISPYCPFSQALVSSLRQLALKVQGFAGVGFVHCKRNFDADNRLCSSDRFNIGEFPTVKILPRHLDGSPPSIKEALLYPPDSPRNVTALSDFMNYYMDLQGPSSGSVEYLTSSNFHYSVAADRHNVWVLLLTTPACHKCDDLRSVNKQAATKYAGSRIKVGELDASSYPQETQLLLGPNAAVESPAFLVVSAGQFKTDLAEKVHSVATDRVVRGGIRVLAQEVNLYAPSWPPTY